MAEAVLVREVGTTVGRDLVLGSLWEGAVTGRVFVIGILEGTTLGFAVFEVDFCFNTELDGSGDRLSSSLDEDTREDEGNELKCERGQDRVPESTGLSNSSSG